jgi:1,4-alpha-glucan branching enzyme
MTAMDFVLALHSHLPWVLHYGRWPHGSDWLCEAALDTYLPLIEELRRLESAGTAAPITIGVTPVLANQLTHPSFLHEMEEFLRERLAHAVRAPDDLAGTGDQNLIPLAGFWRERLERMWRLFDTLNGDVVGELKRLEDAGRLEIIGSAATHGYLPLLGRDESIRLQLAVGFAEHRRLFGRSPRGCWVPECAYRARGPWRPTGTEPGRERAGVDEYLADAGFAYFFADAHLAAAGEALGVYPDVPLGIERFDAERHDTASTRHGPASRSPYRPYVVSLDRRRRVWALIRDPRSSMQVWSRHQGYPGDGSYLEFHKIRWPGGLKLWRVTGPDVDLGGKQPYEPAAARARAESHADHFVSLLASIARGQAADGEVIVAPFDTELLGHWWFEGVYFLGQLYHRLASEPGVRAATASAHLEHPRAAERIRLAEGSWGAHGDHHMWLNDGTRWTWERLWRLEDAYWAVAREGLTREWARPLLAQATRSLLLAQSSDWQFIISTGAVADYAEQRFGRHCEDAETLVAALHPTASDARRDVAARLAAELRWRDALFPNVLDAVSGVLAASAPR